MQREKDGDVGQYEGAGKFDGGNVPEIKAEGATNDAEEEDESLPPDETELGYSS